MRSRFQDAVDRVVADDNCSGCGGCSMISSRVEMDLVDGYMRPRVRTPAVSAERDEARIFRRTCPGVIARAARAESADVHPTFGRFVSAWKAVAVDPAVRYAGSSAGVLTALSTFLLETGRSAPIAAAAASAAAPTRTVSVRITSREEALDAAGSRYAPASVLGPHVADDMPVVGKPCEITALRRLRGADADSPILLSFFCAGVPSQSATEQLIRTLGVDPDDATALRYRGEGWPGEFRVESPQATGSLSYEQSWGEHLGKRLQWRCKICPDGTGADADVAVGDYWKADAKGFPLFETGQGDSVAIARTIRGEALLLAAQSAGVISLEPVDLDDVARVQPLQVRRKRVLLGRLAGRRLAGKRVPRMVGYGLLGLAAQHPRLTLREARGSFSRSAPAFLRTALDRARGTLRSAGRG